MAIDYDDRDGNNRRHALHHMTSIGAAPVRRLSVNVLKARRCGEMCARFVVKMALTPALYMYVGLGSMSTVASALTAEVAKKCEALRLQKYPPRVPGNPAAGSAAGDARAQQSYFNQCTANGGNPPS
jgi:hypothetical protein